jgi:nucleotide-binding universal stress UspA family protein
LYSHILITTDGSDLAQKGVDHGLALAKNLGCKATIITVTEPYPLQSAATQASWADAQREHADAALNRAKAAASAAGVNAEVTQVSSASPAEAIVDAATGMGAGLIVMASHGRRGISRILLGSQTAEVVHHSKIPVLVVR